LIVQALQLVVIPTLTAAFNSKDPKERGIIDEATINLIVKDLLDPGDEVRSATRKQFLKFSCFFQVVLIGRERQWG
jgi:hypothetical protein